MSNKLEFNTTFRLSTTNDGQMRNESSDQNIWIWKVKRVGLRRAKNFEVHIKLRRMLSMQY